MKKIFSLILILSIVLSALVLPSYSLNDGDFQYTVSNNTVTIDKYVGNSDVVNIPSTIDNISVTKISDNAFLDNQNIIEVKIPEGIKSIGNFAFKNCIKLNLISLPQSINHIGKDAFLNTAYYNNDKNWKKQKKSSGADVDITNKPGNDSIDWEDISASDLTYIYLGSVLLKCHYGMKYSVRYTTTVIADYACFNENKIDEIYLYDRLLGIGENSFNGCSRLDNIIIPNTIERIGDMAFANCQNLKNIALPQKPLNLGEDVFLNTALYNDKNNWSQNVFYIDNHLIKSENTFETIVKNGTKFIEGNSLPNVPTLIPDSVTDISDNAFKETSNVTIYGKRNSEAEKFAQKKNIPFVDTNSIMIGDMNGDDQLNANDYAILKDIAQGNANCSIYYNLSGDLNGDKAVDGFDALTFTAFMYYGGNSIIRGDANGDRVITQEDYDILRDVAFGKIAVNDGVMLKRCDLNGDGVVDGFDAIAFAVMVNK